ncbi:MAG: hypothetical protein COV29_03780 [Candidatus Yanofskybacteria bacterium CG10_big_fil_rev_8_21_14_0_10_36_16]|uniref:Phenylacetate--CoA ligase n=1 Tax=Candidatus Yanofskybacteria bacterium CG10_big_fil_rev_8_21_14_0_10_36_16 TaxID=1975096 RepID=A0A2J0Q6L2_9BACT|nr:MAG: hypothetical protein COV29_03780 [Candidatus Yanofskybacteria bacterium CG10_big_fil_rev_8_21_14_0_10_36_16]
MTPLQLKIFKNASKTVPAYRNFLHKNKVNPNKIKTLEDFSTLPITNKKNYIYNYKLKDLFPNSIIPPMSYASSGSSGKPTFWFRSDIQELSGAELHETIFKNIFKINKKEETLVIICFAMGVWIAGNYTLAICRELARKGYRITVATPGVDKNDIFSTLSQLTPHFKNIILAGYPPFLMDIVSEAKTRGINLNQNIKTITAGDKFSEKWRSDYLNNLGIQNNNSSIISIYGSADAGAMAHETPLTIFVRRASLQNKDLYKKLFGETKIDQEHQPSIVQYNPDKIFFEKSREELVLTTNSSAPLIRYNLCDTGEIITHAEMGEIIKEAGLTKQTKSYFNKWRFPFLVLKGRTDVSTTFYAINIYPEHFIKSLSRKEISNKLTGNFNAYSKTHNKSKDQKLYLELELAKGVNATPNFKNQCAIVLHNNLKEVNIEFRKLDEAIGKKTMPEIILKKFGDHGDPAHKGPSLTSTKGKKPKIIK